LRRGNSLEKWVVEIKERCHDNRASFFFNQWGGIKKIDQADYLRTELGMNIPSYHYDKKRLSCLIDSG
jgi:protein gp37